MKKLIFFCVISFTSFNLFAVDINIVDVRRNITLADEDSVYKDFYLNAGDGSGLKKNLVVNVKRRLSVKDSNAKNIGEFETIIGQLRVIHVEGKVAIAREYKLFSRDEEPMIEQIGLMTGDRIDLAGSFIDNAKPVVKKKIADVIPEVDREPASDLQPQTPAVKDSPIKQAIPLNSPEI